MMETLISAVGDYPIVAIFVVAILGVSWRVWRLHRCDKRFGIARNSRGRGGTLSIQTADGIVEVSYEVGATVDMIIYGSSFARDDGQPVKSEGYAQLSKRLAEWAKARRATIDVTPLSI